MKVENGSARNGRTAVAQVIRRSGLFERIVAPADGTMAAAENGNSAFLAGSSQMMLCRFVVDMKGGGACPEMTRRPHPPPAGCAYNNFRAPDFGLETRCSCLPVTTTESFQRTTPPVC
jgi:hypothetical protein